MTLRILHCPNSVGGNAQALARSERQLGLHSWSISLRHNYLDYEVDEVLQPAGAGSLTREANRWKLLFRALQDFDIIHFNFGQSIFPSYVPLPPGEKAANVSKSVFQVYSRALHLRDLWLLKQAGKRIVVTYQGSDARQGDYWHDHYEISHIPFVPELYHARSDAVKRESIARFDRYADRIYCVTPDLKAVLPDRAEYLPLVVDIDQWRLEDAKPVNAAESLTIVHAPTNRAVKGTSIIVEVVRRLQNELDFPIHLHLIENMSNTDARQLFYDADLVIDQVLVGWYGRVGAEAMALGKPVFAYIRDESKSYAPQAMQNELPVINVSPENLHRVLREWMTDKRDQLREHGRLGRRFAETYHDSFKAAVRLQEAYAAIMNEKYP